MKSRRIWTEAELIQYQKQYEAASGLSIPMEYLKSSDVFVIENGREGFVGGFALARNSVMRWPRQIPEGVTLPSHISLNDCAELNALWLDPIWRGRPTSAAFWLFTGRIIGSTQNYNSHITFCVDPEKKGLVSLYQPAAEGVLYEGPVVRCSLPRLRIYFSTPQRFKRIWLHYAPHLLRRFLHRG